MGRPRRAWFAVGLMASAIAAACACGNKPAPESTLSPGDRGFGQSHAEGSGTSGATGQDGSVALGKFHDVLAPRWHADKTPQRMPNTCAASAEFRTGADAIVAASPPNGADAAAWASAGKQLVESVAALDAACKAGDAAAFEPAFTTVHERFHAAMEAGGGHHGEHGAEHKEHGEHKHDEPKQGW